MKSSIWVLIALFYAGCSSPNGNWDSQERVAISIDTTPQWLDAMVITAKAAGNIGDLRTIKRALADLSLDIRHDEVAEQCAIQLANAGYWLAAKETAEMINDEGRRKSAFTKIGG